MNTNQSAETTANNEESRNTTAPVILTKITDEYPAPETEKHCYKLPEEDFVKELAANYGLYAQTAMSIRNKFGMSYSRQAMRTRAKRYYESLKDEQENFVDIAKGTIFEAMVQNNDPKLKFKAAALFLKLLKYGKNQGPFNG